MRLTPLGAEATDAYDVNGDQLFNILDISKLTNILVMVGLGH